MVAQYAEEFRFGFEMREIRASFVFRLSILQSQDSRFLQNLGRIRKIGRACRIVERMAACVSEEAVKTLDEKVAGLFSRLSMPASGCWNIGCFENKRFSVFAPATSGSTVEGLVLTVLKTS